MSHININANMGNTVYWILKNENTGEFLSGQTEANQSTEASDIWSIYIQTENEAYWLEECNNLNISV